MDCDDRGHASMFARGKPHAPLPTAVRRRKLPQIEIKDHTTDCCVGVVAECQRVDIACKSFWAVCTSIGRRPFETNRTKCL
jgi:hypothetical protein